MKKLVLFVAAFMGLGVLFIWMAGGFVGKLGTDPLPTVGEPLDGRETVRVQLKRVPQWQAYTGTLIADQQATLSARITAQVADVLVRVGDEVKAGDVLLRLDNQDLDARVRQSQQALASRQARLNQARKDYRRVLALQETQAVSKAQLDLAESEQQSAEASFKQAQASLSEAQTTLGFSLITAPFDGVITQKFVSKGDTASPGVAMLSLYNPNSLVVEAQVAAGYRSLLSEGQLWPVELPELTTQIVGQITEITPAADPSSRSVLVRLSFSPSQGVKLYDGLFARLSVQTGQEEWLVLPPSARYRIGQLEYVKVVKGERVVPRLVQTKKGPEGELLIRQGLSPKELVLKQGATGRSEA